MKTKKLLTLLAATTAIAASSANAAVINLTDLTSTPDGTATRTAANFDVETLNGGTRVLVPGTVASAITETAFIVTTLTWGAASDAHIGIGWDHTSGGVDTSPSRLGVQAEDTGLFSLFGGLSDNTNLAQDMAGQTVTLILKFYYDAALGNNSTSASFWINPTTSSTEGAPTVASATSWNSNNFPELILYIDNQSTPGTSGASSITNTKILTGSTDATFANALALATIPEPSAALLGGLGALLLLRRRRN